MQELQSFIRFPVQVARTLKTADIYIADLNEKEAFEYLREKLTKVYFGLGYKENPRQVKVFHLDARGVKREDAEADEKEAGKKETGETLLRPYYEFISSGKEEYSIFVSAKNYEAARNKVKALDVFLKFRTNEDVPQLAYFFFPNSKTLEEPKEKKAKVEDVKEEVKTEEKT